MEKKIIRKSIQVVSARCKSGKNGLHSTQVRFAPYHKWCSAYEAQQFGLLTATEVSDILSALVEQYVDDCHCDGEEPKTVRIDFPCEEGGEDNE